MACTSEQTSITLVNEKPGKNYWSVSSEIHSGHLRKSALPFPPKHTLKQMRCNGDSLAKILVHKYCNLTETNVDLLSEIIVSGSLYAVKNWHRVALSLWRLEVKAKALKAIVRSSILKGKVFIS